ncbi:hypothetical protein SAMN05216524_10766 [Mucilaginibacter sp. OK098]|nr:hypothetical protein SAMN05216524_10766 [Mucilaginibacter sp. OK098]
MHFPPIKHHPAQAPLRETLRGRVFCRRATCAVACPRAKHGAEAFARVVVRQAHHDIPSLSSPLSFSQGLLKGTLRRVLSIQPCIFLPSNIIQRRLLCERPCGDGAGILFCYSFQISYNIFRTLHLHYIFVHLPGF